MPSNPTKLVRDMCSHYEPPTPQQLQETFKLVPDEPYQEDLWPGRRGPFIRNTAPATWLDDVPEAEALVGVFGLLPSWAKDEKLARRTYNARTETVATLPSFRSAWAKARHCIIPAAAIYEPDWRSGKAKPARISRKDGQLLGIAGLWEVWKNPAGELVHSFTMLTLDAAGHDVMGRYHKPGDEKRMTLILPAGAYRDWLSASPGESGDFIRQYPADRLIGVTEGEDPE